MPPLTITRLADVFQFSSGYATVVGFAATTPGWLGGGVVAYSTELELLIGLSTVFAPAAGLGYANNNAPVVAVFEAGFDLGSAIFELNGAPAISYNSLPSGFTVTALTLTLGLNTGNTFGADTFDVRWDGNVLTPTLVGGTFAIYTAIVVISTPTTANDLLGQRLLITVNLTPSVPLPGLENLWIDPALVLTGTYEIENFTFDISTPSRSLQPGDTITVTSNPLDPTPMDFTDILTLNIITLDVDGNPFGVAIPIPQILWTTITANLWVFTLPAFLSNGIPNFITLQVTSTQFAGTVDLITAYPIYFFNAPGIYQLVPGETHDTYYNRLSDPISTIDTKIPNPFGKTGFF